MSHMITVKYPTVSAATAEQMARDQQAERLKRINEAAQQHGGIHHMFVEDPDGSLLVVNEWASEDSMRQFIENQQDIPQLLEAMGTAPDAEPEVTVRRVLDTPDRFSGQISPTSYMITTKFPSVMAGTAEAAAHDQHAERTKRISAEAAQQGCMAHMFTEDTDGGTLVVDLWPDEATYRRFFESQLEIGKMVQEIGGNPDQAPEVTAYRVLDTPDRF
jgi:hypothetical protein